MTRIPLFLPIVVALITSGPASATIKEELAVLKGQLDQQQSTIEDQSRQIQVLLRRLTNVEAGLSGESAEARESVLETKAALEVQSTDVAVQKLAETTEEPTSQPKEDVSQGVDSVRRKLSTGKESQLAKQDTVLNESVDIYGSFRIFASAGTDDSSLRSGSSRMGLKFKRRATPTTEFFGRAEWRINLVDSESEFSSNENPGGGITVQQSIEREALETRLGFVGARFGDNWSVAAGKQWSVYYDVSGWTDNFNVFGGTGLSTYNADTDGGASGTGRADQAFILRRERGPLDFSLQAQLQSTQDGSDYNGVGGSLRWHLNDNFDVGLAFAESRVEGAFEDLTGSDKSGSYVLGARYHSGPWYAAAAVADWNNHEAVFLDDDTIIYDGRGAEVYVSYEYSDVIHIYGGLNYTDPDVNDPRVDDDFGRVDLIVGAAKYTTKDSFSYLELLLSDGTEADGSSQETILTFGFRYDF